MPKFNKKELEIKKDKFLASLDVTIPENLNKYLDEKQRGLLKCYMANCNFGEIATGLHISRSSVIINLIELGGVLNMYNLLENGLIPNVNNMGEGYMKGWLDSRTQLWRLINDKITRR